MNKRFDGIDSDEKSSFTSILYRYSGKMEENILFWGYAISFLNAAIVYFSGGTTMVFSNLNYIPIAMVSSNCKKCSRIIHAVVTAFLIGPFMPLDTKLGISQTTLNWTTRLGIYIIIACAIGIFSDLNKRHGEDLARILSTDWFGYMLKNWKRKHTAVQIYSYNRKDKEYCKKYCESQQGQQYEDCSGRN